VCFFFFSTDGKSFAEFLFLLEEEKSKRAKSPIKQYNNPQCVLQMAFFRKAPRRELHILYLSKKTAVGTKGQLRRRTTSKKENHTKERLHIYGASNDLHLVCFMCILLVCFAT